MSIQEFADKFAIQENLQRYMMAIDRPDRQALRAVFSDDAVMQLLEPLDPDAYCDFVDNIMSIIRTNHVLLNSVIDLDGDTAQSVSYFWAYHRVPGQCEDPACVAIFGLNPVDTDVLLGGYYQDESVRTAKGWKIRRRVVNLLWQQHRPSEDHFGPDWFTPPPWFSGLGG